MAFGKFHALKINLAIGFTRKTGSIALVRLNDAVPWLTKRQVEYFDLQPTFKISKFTCILSAGRMASLP